MPYEAVPVGRLLGSMEDAANDYNIIILDACRDNPFARQWRSSQRGLAVVQAVRGSLIAYATAPGAVALDGSGRNGLYTSHVLHHLPTPGLSVEHLFKRVREGVVKDTKGTQTPWESSSLIGDFAFASPPGGTPLIGTNPGLPPPAVSTSPAPTGPDPEAVMWALVETSTDIADVQAFLDAYPKSRLTPAARLKLQQLQRLAAQQRVVDPQRLANQERQQHDAAEAQQRVEAQRREDERKRLAEAKRREEPAQKGPQGTTVSPPPHVARLEPEGKLRERAAVAVPAATLSGVGHDEQGARQVRAFRMDVRPVSNREFLTFVHASPQWQKSHMSTNLQDGDYLKHWPGDETVNAEEMERPVRYVSYFAAEAYCKAQGKKVPKLNHYRTAAKAEVGNIEITYDMAYQAPDFHFVHTEWTDSWWSSSGPEPGKRIKYQDGTMHTNNPQSRNYSPEEDKRYTGRALGFRCAEY